MRKFIEPSARNLLRKPLVLGVPFSGLLGISFVSLSVFILGGNHLGTEITALGLGVVGYIVLRVFSRFAKHGWEERPLFRLELLRKVPHPDGTIMKQCPRLTLSAPDTLTETDLLTLKDELAERLLGLKPQTRWTLVFSKEKAGVIVELVSVQGRFDLKAPLSALTDGIASDSDFAYSLYQLPVVTDPLWSFGLMKQLPEGSRVIVTFGGVNASEIKKRLEHARRSNAQGDSSLLDIDSAVSFEEATNVLQGLSRGEEKVLETAMVVLAPENVELDEALFCKEKEPWLAVLSALGIRRRFHRSHWVRVATACDLVPTVCDAAEAGAHVLKTPRGAPLYFSPQDPRLEALHWLVVGASGSGKSFFTGLVLKRMIEQGVPMSVLFVDHNRSFRRLVQSTGQPFLEPKSHSALELGCAQLFDQWNRPGSLSGIELSDLDIAEKKAAVHTLLSRVETFLRFRDTTHPLYLVLDECWNFMRDEPVLVQRAFREFRKLNGAVVAITQSLNDFLTDESGQSIFQNAPVRILLRQGEDVSRYQGILGLNSVEAARLARLRQEKGVYSECLVKTPFLSRLGRLYPSDAEHALLRTDNLRAELIQQAKAKRSEPCASALS